MRHIVFGADRETDQDRKIAVDAISASETESIANWAGILVSSVQPLKVTRHVLEP